MEKLNFFYGQAYITYACRRKAGKEKEMDEQETVKEERDITENVQMEAMQEENASRNEETPSEKKSKPKNKVKEIIKELLFYVILFVVVLYVIPNYVGTRTVVDGESMENTLQDKDSVLLDKLTYRFNDPKRFDIIVFYHFDDINNQDKHDKDAYEFYVKRVIGLPGETVQIIGETIYINGEALKEHFGKDPIDDSGIAEQPITLGKDEYFVLGDNREISKDSRDPEVGPVKEKWIAGKVKYRIYPFRSFGTVK